MKLRPTILAAASLAAALLVVPMPEARAQAQPPRATLKVREIQASGKPDAEARAAAIDERLADLAAQLRRWPYARFELVGEPHVRSVAFGEEMAVDLSGGLVLTAVAREGDAGAVALEVKIRDADGAAVVTTGLHLRDGRTCLIGRELETANGVLFLALTVQRE